MSRMLGNQIYRSVTVLLLVVTCFSLTHAVSSSSSSQRKDADLLKTLQNEVAALKGDLKRGAKVLELHDELISKLEQLTQKQAEVIKTLEVVTVNNNQGLKATDFVRRSCQEILSFNPTLPSGLYWIDPDGQGVGDAPLVVHCDMATGWTSIPHDTESTMDMGSCRDPGCYTRPIGYKATLKQMIALIDLSNECRQSIRYDCVNAPFQFNGVPQSWWLDRKGVPRYFWSGSGSEDHTCQCGISKNCTDPSLRCNCDAMSPIPMSDYGFITNKSILPITLLKFGRTLTPLASGRHTVGRLECKGNAATTHQAPTSCQDLWHAGHSQSGFYSVRGAEGQQIETVFCNMTEASSGPGMQKWIGYNNIKTRPVYFYVQRYHHYAVKNSVIPFEVEHLNIGGAFNVTAGVFTAPSSGVYFFSFTGLRSNSHNEDQTRSSTQIHIQVNGQTVGTAFSSAASDSLAQYHMTVSLQSTLSLARGDKVRLVLAWGTLFYLANHFSGILLEEHLG